RPVRPGVRGSHRGRDRLSLPAVDLVARLRAGRVVLVTEEGEAGLLLVPRQPAVLALAREDRRRRRRRAGRQDVDAVFLLGLRRDDVDEGLSVLGPMEFEHVGDGALGAAGKAADDEVGAVHLRWCPRTALGACPAEAARTGRRPRPCRLVLGLLLALFHLGLFLLALLLFGLLVVGLLLLGLLRLLLEQVGDVTGRLFGDLEALDALDPGDLPVAQIHDGHAGPRHLLG